MFNLLMSYCSILGVAFKVGPASLRNCVSGFRTFLCLTMGYFGCGIKKITFKFGGGWQENKKKTVDVSTGYEEEEEAVKKVNVI